ncbi:methyltransferase domain-containing protein [Vibrio atypicus]|uniref:methyltransferase domain-containing protein n=1 Tax=Vibrio atypicus TaxID=558271 RepID=UPI0013576036|nr:methyltransferase domain-containing protein [Vibrio atypicus]
MSEEIRLLDAEQTAAFDEEYISKEMFVQVTETLDRHLNTPEVSRYLDVGGGNGLYADKLLSRYPNSSVTVVEPEPSLLQKNRPHENKVLREGIFQDVDDLSDLDLIQFNWVLHHFVSSDYASTCNLQLNSLKQAHKMLAPGGLVIIFENFYEGMECSDKPGERIYHLTASKLLKPFTSRLGANTAGVGVAFHSELYWREQLMKAGFDQMFSTHCYDFGNLSPLKRKLLRIKEQRVGMLVGIKS